MPSDWLPFLGTFFIGLSKAGFAAGLGMVTTPMLASAMPAREALGVVLPLLCAADLLTVAVYWGKWDFRLVRYPLVGTVLGILGGMLFVNSISDRILKVSIGATGLVLVVLLVVRRLWYPGQTWRPSAWESLAVGVAAGFSSTVSHAAGPIMALFLIAQRVDKQVFVATSAIFFALNNLLKVPPYLAAGLINSETLAVDLRLLAAVPLGIAAGWLANRYLPQRAFDGLVYLLLFFTSIHLVWPA